MEKLSMNKILFYFLLTVSLFTLSCKKNNQSPTSIDQSKSEPAPYILGDTSGYANRPTGWIVLRQEARAIKIIQPQNPEYAKINKIDGRVFIHCCVTKVGTVRGAVVDSTNNDIFNRTCLEATIQWEFTPAIGVDSLPMESWYFVPFVFHNN